MAKVGSTGSGKEIKLFKDAAEIISALKLVRAINDLEIRVASSTVDFTTAQVLGMAITAGIIGAKIQVLVLGEFTDALFSGFTVNNPLFLASNGSITETPPGPTDFRSQIGKALGNSAIFINIEQPIELA